MADEERTYRGYVQDVSPEARPAPGAKARVGPEVLGMIEFVVLMEPVAKGRPRFGKGFTYTAPKTRKFERDFSLAAGEHAPMSPLSGPLELAILFQLKPPKRPKRDYPHVRPDIDNFTKAVMDSMKGFWVDDAQIVCLYARKRYGHVPLIKVELKEVGVEL